MSGMSGNQTNLIFHIYPTKDNGWRWTLGQVLERLHLFTGRRIFYVAADDDGVFAEVSNVLKPYNCTHTNGPNDPVLCEVPGFRTMLGEINKCSSGFTFYGHTKQILEPDSHLDREFVRLMIQRTFSQEAIKALEAFSAVGIYRQHKHHLGSSWCYGGTFFGFRNQAVFSSGNKWRMIEKCKHGVEMWIGQQIALADSCCLHGDGINPYEEVRWKFFDSIVKRRVETELSLAKALWLKGVREGKRKVDDK